MTSVSRFFGFACACLLALGCGGSAAPVASTTPSSSTSTASANEGDASVTRPAIVTLLGSGSWGWVEGAHTCETNAVTYRFSDDLRSVTAIDSHPVPNPDTGVPETEYSYDIEAIGDDRIRMRLRDETRRAADGALVVWDLVVLSRDAFCWHRTDWPDGACTGSLERCD